MSYEHGRQRERLGEPILLPDATVQEIQLELIRRTNFNDLNGRHVAESLMRRRDLWLSVMLQRQPYWSKDYTHLSFSWLIQMRDMPRNVWNADTLFLVTDSIEKARRLEQIATDDDNHWNGEFTVDEDQEEVDRALDAGRLRMRSFPSGGISVTASLPDERLDRSE